MRFFDFFYCFLCLWKTYRHLRCYKPSDVSCFLHGFSYLFSTFTDKMNDFSNYFISYRAVDNLWKTCENPEENLFETPEEPTGWEDFGHY